MRAQVIAEYPQVKAVKVFFVREDQQRHSRLIERSRVLTGAELAAHRASLKCVELMSKHANVLAHLKPGVTHTDIAVALGVLPVVAWQWIAALKRAGLWKDA